ncbi:MAG: EthD domain-containing protein [Sphingomonadales bacterium]|nr:EthD domain-containing protein [Sphingomonadales bacterium]
MIRVMWLLRRKPGISHAQFRHHYETSHAVLGERHLGHLMTAYRRHYVAPAEAAGSAVMQAVLGAKGWDYDCIADWEMADAAAFEQVVATLSDPEIGKLFHDDEEHFLDRSSVRLMLCDSAETDVSASVPGVERALMAARSQWDG